MLLFAIAAASVGDLTGSWPLDLPDARGLDVEGDTVWVLQPGTAGRIQEYRLGTTLVPTRTLIEANLKGARGLDVRTEAEGRVAYTTMSTPAGPLLVRIGPRGEVRRARLPATDVLGLAFTDTELWIAVPPEDDDSGFLVVPLGDRPVLDGVPEARKVAASGASGPKGRFASRGVALATVDGHPYLWGTIASHALYAMDLHGRGLFSVPRPLEPGDDVAFGLAGSEDTLWTLRRSRTDMELQRLDLADDTPRRGPRRVRRMTEIIVSRPEPGRTTRGGVVHNFGIPAPVDGQGWDPASLALRDESEPMRTFQVRDLAWNPGDTPVPMKQMAYANVTRGDVSSTATFDVWTQSLQPTVYPHRVTATSRPAPYLADSMLYGLDDHARYDAFLERVRAYLVEHWRLTPAEAEAELHHPYWAGRAVVEYVHWRYRYPSPTRGVNPTLDWARGHYPGGPAPLKLALSEGRVDGQAVVACDASAVMLDGVMKYLGHPARWIGTTHQTQQDGHIGAEGPWDLDGDGLLGPGERATSLHGHKTTEVWLGERYGWQLFDATPQRVLDARGPYPLVTVSQARLMEVVAGRRAPERVVLNVGTGKVPYLFIEPEPAVRYGNDQTYNLLGKYDHPDLWAHPWERIWLEAAVTIDVALDPSGQVTWERRGRWDLLPGATLDVILEQLDVTGKVVRTRPVELGVPVKRTGLRVTAPPGRYRVRVRLTGDPDSGGLSDVQTLTGS
ncbi:MAG: hypothetical protein R3F61_25505 [Myxococcota bacterium]